MDDYISNTIKLTKNDQYEVINIGDIIMIDTDTHKVTKAVLNEPGELIYNSRMVVGVCIESDNDSPIIQIIDGGSARDVKRESLEFSIDGGTSAESSRQIVGIAYSGECVVNTIGEIEPGDDLCISKYAGKAKRKNYFDTEYFDLRSIGKVSEYTEDNKVKVILNIK